MKTLLSLFALLTLSLPALAQERLRVEDAWVREAPPTAAVLGAFMHLHNSGDDEVLITGASSPACETVEIHQTVIEGGVARMLPQNSLRLAPGEHIDLAPGGYHLMLINPHQSPRAGDTLEITLEYGEGQHQTVRAEVRQGMGGMEGHDHQHHH